MIFSFSAEGTRRTLERKEYLLLLAAAQIIVSERRHLLALCLYKVLRTWNPLANIQPTAQSGDYLSAILSTQILHAPGLLTTLVIQFPHSPLSLSPTILPMPHPYQCLLHAFLCDWSPEWCKQSEVCLCPRVALCLPGNCLLVLVQENQKLLCHSMGCNYTFSNKVLSLEKGTPF